MRAINFNQFRSAHKSAKAACICLVRRGKKCLERKKIRRRRALRWSDANETFYKLPANFSRVHNLRGHLYAHLLQKRVHIMERASAERSFAGCYTKCASLVASYRLLIVRQFKENDAKALAGNIFNMTQMRPI